MGGKPPTPPVKRLRRKYGVQMFLLFLDTNFLVKGNFLVNGCCIKRAMLNKMARPFGACASVNWRFFV